MTFNLSTSTDVLDLIKLITDRKPYYKSSDSLVSNKILFFYFYMASNQYHGCTVHASLHVRETALVDPEGAIGLASSFEFDFFERG